MSEQGSSFFMQGTAACAALPPARLTLWLDPIARTGYQNMAADELLTHRSEAWLRVYRWARPSVSFGYFDTQQVAERIFPGKGIDYIRRWTGGGIVDHRIGETYTLTLPSIADVMYPASDVLYRWIHGALAEALNKNGVECELLGEDAPDGGRACWASPVMSDIVDAHGHKLAGAGQRRYKGALLHQGLIQDCAPNKQWPQDLASALCSHVTIVTSACPYEGFEAELQELCASKYESEAWHDEQHGRRKPTLK